MNQAFQREAPQLAQMYWTAWDHARWSQQGQRSQNVASEIKIPDIEPVQAEAELSAKVEPLRLPWWQDQDVVSIQPYILAANGWNREHVQTVQDELVNHKDVGSLGYDGPLAVLARHRVNLADFFKETVAVVTNPAVDHARQAEVFSTSSLLGTYPAVGKAPNPGDRMVVLKVPILTGGHPEAGTPESAQAAAE
jgi:hypothetical protein